MAEEPPNSKPLFSEREDHVLRVAWRCLKNVPEIDIQKLTEYGGFKTQKTASNTWGTIKKKLATYNPTTATTDGGEEPACETPTPKARAGKGNVTPRKRKKTAIKYEEDEDDGAGDDKLGEDDDD